MKRILAASLMLAGLLTSDPAHAANAFVQANAAGAPVAASTFSVTFAGNTTAGNFIIVGFDFDSNSTVSSVTDKQNNGFVQVGPELVTLGGVHSRVYFAKDIKGGPDSVVINLTGTSSYIEEYIVEYAGVDRTNPIDAVKSNSGPAGPVTSGNATTTVSGDLLYAFCIPDWGCSAGAGFTPRLTLFNNLVEDRIAGAPGLYAATGSATSAWTMIMVALRAADATTPSVSLTAPSAGSASGTVSVSGTASDNVGVVGVQFLLDGANLGAEDTTLP